MLVYRLDDLIYVPFFFSSLLEELGSSCLSFFSLSPIIINPYPHPPSLTTSTSLCLFTSVDGHGIALTPWRLAPTIIIIKNLFILPPSSSLLSLYILFFLLFILRAGWNQPCAIGKALVRAPMVLERPLKLYFFPISSSLGTEALHLTHLHPLPPYVACKAPGTALAQPAVWRTTLWPPPLLLYSTSHNIYIYTFFQSLCFYTSCLYLFGFFCIMFFYPNLSPIYLSYSLFLMTPRLPYGGFYFVFLILEI